MSVLRVVIGSGASAPRLVEGQGSVGIVPAPARAANPNRGYRGSGASVQRQRHTLRLAGNSRERVVRPVPLGGVEPFGRAGAKVPPDDAFAAQRVAADEHDAGGGEGGRPRGGLAKQYQAPCRN